LVDNEREQVVDRDYLYVAMLKGLLEDKGFAVTVTNVFEPSYFEDPAMVGIFKAFKNHLDTYNTLPDKDIVINSVPRDIKDEVVGILTETETTDFDVAKNYDWLRRQTNIYLKQRAIKQSIIKSVDVIDKNGDYDEIKRLVETALCKDININLGLDYFGTMKERLTRIFTSSDNRIKTYYPTLDELFNGGYPPYTLNMFIAKIHGHKCVQGNTLITIKNDLHEKIKKIKIGDFYKYTCGDEHLGGTNMPSLKVFQNKYGEEEGQVRYDSWRMSGSTKGVSKLVLFQNKYGEEEGQVRYDSWLDKNRENGKKSKGRRTILWYINKYGEEEGQVRYDKFCQNLSNSMNKGQNSLQWYINKYGEEEGQVRYDEKNSKISDIGRCTLPWFISKHGEEEGQVRYDKYISKQKFSQSKDGYMAKHGDNGIIMWNKRCEDIKRRNTLQGHIDRYGEEGKKLFDDRQEKWLNTLNSKSPEEIERINRVKVCNIPKSNGFSRMSQNLFWILYNEVYMDFNDIQFATLDNNKELDVSGFNSEKFIRLTDRNVFADFFIGDTNKIIEFDGDYWHGEVRGNKKRDEERTLMLEQCGYHVLHIKERDYNNNCDTTIKICLDFIYG